MTPCTIPTCPNHATHTVRVRLPSWRVAESRPVCKRHHDQVERARLAADAQCAIPGCPRERLARHLCQHHIDVAYPLGALGLYGWWPTSGRRPTGDEVRRLVAEMRRGRAA